MFVCVPMGKGKQEKHGLNLSRMTEMNYYMDTCWYKSDCRKHKSVCWVHQLQNNCTVQSLALINQRDSLLVPYSDSILKLFCKIQQLKILVVLDICNMGLFIGLIKESHHAQIVGNCIMFNARGAFQKFRSPAVNVLLNTEANWLRTGPDSGLLWAR